MASNSGGWRTSRASRVIGVRALLGGLLAGALGACAPKPCQGGALECTRDYHLTVSSAGIGAASDSIDAYFDYSLGMGEGMRANDQLNAALKNFLVGRTVQYWKVGASTVPVEIDIGSRAADLQNLDNFRDSGSNLLSTILRTVEAPQRTAIFVTDFERVDNDAMRVTHAGALGPHRIETSAWAQVPFRQWLEQGHRIDVFAQRHQKPDYWFGAPFPVLENWIYILVFTPEPILRDPLRLEGSVLRFLLEEYAKRQSPDFRHFTFWAGAFEVTAVNSSSTGNVNENIPVYEFGVLAGRPPADYHELGQGDLVSFANDQRLPDKRVFNGVAITPAIEFLKALVFGVQVSDVTAAIARLDSARTQPAREFEVDPANNDTTWKGPALIPVTPLLPAILRDSVFDLTYNPETKVAGLVLNPAFAGVSQPTVFRVDIVIQAAELIDFAEIDQVTALNYRGGYRIRALGESLRLASRDVANAMVGKVVYTSYVRITP